MHSFFRGILVGMFFKKKIINILDTIIIKVLQIKNSIGNDNNQISIINENKATLVIKLNTQLPMFLPPYWRCSKNKIIIDLPNEIMDVLFNSEKEEYSFLELMETKNKIGEYIVTLDLQYLKTLGNLYLYLNYTYENRKYINVYSEYSIIKNSDFISSKEYVPDILSVSLKYNNNKTEYLTIHTNKFLRNETIITPEILLLNYEPLESINLEDSKLFIVNTDGISKFLYKEPLLLKVI